MKIVQCNLYNHKSELIYKTYNVEEMSELISNDGADYSLYKIDSMEYKHSLDIRLDFEHGLTLFLTVEK